MEARQDPATTPSDGPRPAVRAIPDGRSPCRIDVAKGPHRHRCSASHADLVDGYRLAAEAQEARAEAYSNGYVTELEEFYRDVEPRLTFRAYLAGYVDTSRQAWAA